MLDAVRRPFAVAAILLGSSAALCVDGPELRLNEASGLVEVVDAAWSGSNYNVRYTLATTDGKSQGSTFLTTNTGNDLDPRIAGAPSGDTFVAWWRDLKVDAVIYRKRTFATESWGPERILGLTTESGSRPRIAYFNGEACVAYQIQGSKSRSVGTQIFDDDPEPFRAVVATTSYGGNLDIQIDSEMHHLWVTWIDSTSIMGFSEYDPESRSWDLPTFESFSTDSAAAARMRIRSRVLDIAESN